MKLNAQQGAANEQTKKYEKAKGHGEWFDAIMVEMNTPAERDCVSSA